jgi:hypothetical protein
MNKDKILKFHLDLNKELQNTLELTTKSLSETKFIKTGTILNASILKMGYINNSIIDCYTNGNAYSINILMRSLIEHGFRHMYIYVKALKDDNDDVGIEYYGGLRGSEDLRAVSKINTFENIVFPKVSKMNIRGPHNKMINKIGDKFEIKKILFYIINNFPESSEYVHILNKKYSIENLRKYAHLSSYVHGGPYAEDCFSEILKNNNQNEYIKDITKEALSFYKEAINATYLFASLNNEDMEEHYANMKKIELN